MLSRVARAARLLRSFFLIKSAILLDAPDHDMERVFEAKKHELLKRFPMAHPRVPRFLLLIQKASNSQSCPILTQLQLQLIVAATECQPEVRFQSCGLRWLMDAIYSPSRALQSTRQLPISVRCIA